MNVQDPIREPGPTGEPGPTRQQDALGRHDPAGEPLVAQVSIEASTEAFTQWYRQEYSQVVALVYALSGSRWAAEELTQEAFTKAHQRWADIAGYENPGAWVRRVAVNSARSWGRRKAAETRALTKHTLRKRDLPNELSEPTDDFWSQVRKLPKGQAQVVALHYLEDRPVDEIAEILGVTPGTVKTQLHRARTALRDLLQLGEAQ